VSALGGPRRTWTSAWTGAWAWALAVVILAVSCTLAVGLARRGSDGGARCGEGFVARSARCIPAREGACPAPLEASPHGCDAPDVRVLVPETTLALGPSDWEAEGRVVPRTVHAGPFRIDAFEVTRGRWTGATTMAVARASGSGEGNGEGSAGTIADAARAASGMTRDDAEAFCARRVPGGRLPTEDEWIVAAVAGARSPPRYPWGDTGAVCRRAAWGLAVGPCAVAADAADTVGSHPDGDSALGLHDLAGNVAEWVAPPSSSGAPALHGTSGMAKGGSWETALATELRVWARLALDPSAHDARVGFRCVYPA